MSEVKPPIDAFPTPQPSLEAGVLPAPHVNAMALYPHLFPPCPSLEGRQQHVLGPVWGQARWLLGQPRGVGRGAELGSPCQVPLLLLTSAPTQPLAPL